MPDAGGTFTEWGVRYRRSGSHEHVAEFGDDEAAARAWMREVLLPGVAEDVVCRTVTRTEWREAVPDDCGACHRCLAPSFPTFPGTDVRYEPYMIVCEVCGNKRCPHATDHAHTCTGSNEPGQPGSRYGMPNMNPDEWIEVDVDE